MTTLSIRIEEKTKNEARKTLESLGLDLSSAVKIFLHQVVIDQGLPFTPSTTPKQVRDAWDKEVAYALKRGKSYTTSEEMHKDIFR